MATLNQLTQSDPEKSAGPQCTVHRGLQEVYCKKIHVQVPTYHSLWAHALQDDNGGAEGVVADVDGLVHPTPVVHARVEVAMHTVRPCTQSIFKGQASEIS